jgi:hypothetical protein
MDVADTGSEDTEEPDAAAPYSRSRIVLRYVLLAVLAAIGVAGVVAAIMLPTLHLGRHPAKPTAPRSAPLVHRHPIVLTPPLHRLAGFDWRPIGFEDEV